MNPHHLPHVAVASQCLALCTAAQTQPHGSRQIVIAQQQMLPAVQPEAMPAALQAVSAGARKAMIRAAASSPESWGTAWHTAWMSWLAVCNAWSIEAS